MCGPAGMVGASGVPRKAASKQHRGRPICVWHMAEAIAARSRGASAGPSRSTRFASATVAAAAAKSRGATRARGARPSVASHIATPLPPRCTTSLRRLGRTRPTTRPVVPPCPHQQRRIRMSDEMAAGGGVVVVVVVVVVVLAPHPLGMVYRIPLLLVTSLLTSCFAFLINDSTHMIF